MIFSPFFSFTKFTDDLSDTISIFLINNLSITFWRKYTRILMFPHLYFEYSKFYLSFIIKTPEFNCNPNGKKDISLSIYVDFLIVDQKLFRNHKHSSQFSKHAIIEIIGEQKSFFNLLFFLLVFTFQAI